MYICNTHDVFKTTKRTDAAIEHGSAICPPKKPMSNRKGACLYCRKYTLFLMCTQYQTHMMHRTCILCLLRMLSFLRHFCSTVNTVAASMSQVIGALLKKLFDKDCWDISTSGVLLPGSNGVNHKLFAKLGFFLQDGAAQILTWHSRVESGSKFCLLCKHLITKQWWLLQAASKQLLQCLRMLEGKAGCRHIVSCCHMFLSMLERCTWS